MKIVFILDLVVMIPLAWAFVLLWKQRKRFHTFGPIIIGIIFSFGARSCEVLVEHPGMHLFISRFWEISRDSFNLTFDITGGFFDVFAILSLVVGFVRTIEFQLAKEKTIENLERLLPICAGCKQYRTEDGMWRPIEEYLKKTGTSQMTHGICPNCTAKMKKELSQLVESHR